MTTLDECRKEWEKSLIPVAETQRDEGTYLVILRRKDVKRDGKQPYFCHRYFSIGGDWTVSVDASNVDAETAMKWAWKPKALSMDSEQE
jgi:hypothetical protein